MNREELETIAKEVVGDNYYVTASDLMMAAVIYELRELQKRQSVVSNNMNVTGIPPLDVLAPRQSMFGNDLAPGDEEVVRVEMSYKADRKIPVIKAIRTALALDLKSAKDMSETRAFSVTRYQLKALVQAFNTASDLRQGDVLIYPIK